MMPKLRSLIVASFGVLVLGAGHAARAAELPALPKAPITINVLDVAGNLALTQKAFDDYRQAHPQLVSRFVFTKATAPEVPAKVMAQQNANRVDIDIILTGTDALAAGLEQGLWLRILPDYAAKFPNLQANYLPPAAAMLKLSADHGILITYYPSGPLIEYAPERVKDVPNSAETLLAWCKAHPNRFMYARPANSGPGRTLLMGLPYLLSDKDPMDPVNGWDKTWAYLKELNSCIEYYPSGTGVTMQSLGNGSVDMIASTTGWDINPRALGVVPESAKIGTLKGFHWVTDAHYIVVPKGLQPDHLAVVLDVIAFLLQPKEQAYAYDEGYFYPGPAVKDVPITLAPKSSQDVIKQFGRPEYETLIADNPKEVPLDAKGLVAAFRKWDEMIGGAKSK